MQRQMFAKGGPVRMQQGGLAGISNSLQNANRSLGTAQQQLQKALGGGMGQFPAERRGTFPGLQTSPMQNPMTTLGALARPEASNSLSMTMERLQKLIY